MRLAIAGLGGMGRLYLDTFSRIAGADVVCALSASCPAEAEKAGVKMYTELDAMLDAEKPDALCVCTPTFLHYEQIKAALERGVSVIAEKPLVFRPAEAAELFNLAREKGARLHTAQVVRFSRPAREMKRLVESGEYGAVLDAEFSRTTEAPAWKKNLWVFDSEKSGLVPYELYLHDLDLMFYLFGPPRASRLVSKSPAGADPRHIGFIRCAFDYGGFGVHSGAGWYAAKVPFRAWFRIALERAVCECVNDELFVYPRGGEPVSLCGGDTGCAADTGINVPKTDMYYTELSHFVSCLERGAASDVVSEQDVIGVLEILGKHGGTHE